MANLGDMVVRIVGDMTDFNKSIDAAHAKFESATSNFSKLGKGLSTFVTLPILALGAAAVKSAADMEMLSAEFTTLLGNSDSARDLLEQLTDLAAKTPFQLTDLAQASKTMLSFGIAAENVLPNIQMLGDIAGGNAEKLRSLTLAFSQITSTGRLMGQDLLQLINAGFNPLQSISKRTGETMAELKKRMEAGAVSAEEVAGAFKEATSEGGMFFGGMERASQTFTGQLSTLKDDAVALARSFGEVLLPVMKDILADVSAFVKRFSDLDDNTKKTIINMSLFAAAAGPAIIGAIKFAETIFHIKKQMDLLKVASPQTYTALIGVFSNPILLAVIAVGAGIAVVAAGLKKAKAEADTLKVALEGVATTEQMISAIRIQREKVAAAEASIAAVGSASSRLSEEAKKAAIDAAQKRLAAESAVLNQLVKQYTWSQETQKGEAERARIAAEAAEKEYAALAAKSMAVVSTETTIREETKETTDEIVSQYGFAKDAQLAILQEVRDAKEKEHQDELDRIEEEKKARVESAKYAYGQLDAFIDQLTENEITNIEQSGMSEEKKAKKIAEARRKQAVWDKAQGIADVAINTAVAFTKALPNVVLAGIIAALGVGQAAAIAATPLPAVPLANGGVVMPKSGGTLAQIAEAGQPEAVIPLDKLDMMGGEMRLIVNIDSRPILDKVFNATKNRTVLIDAGAIV